MIDFPINPSLNQIFTSPAGKKWKWNGVKWSGFGSESTGSPIIISDTAPVGALNGQLWFDSTSGITSIYYDNVWVDVGGGDSNDELSPLNVVDSPTLDFSYSASTRTLSANTVFKEFSFRNKIINGNFGIWQRGTSLASGTGERFLADRFLNESVGSTYTTTQQPFTLVPPQEVPGEPTYFHRTIVSSVAGTNNRCVLAQRIESVRTLAGKTATLSFYAKADTAKPMSVEFNQFFGVGGSPSSTIESIGVQKLNLTTSWQKFNINVTIPTISGKTLGTNNNDSLTIIFWFDAHSNFNSRTNSLGQQSGTFDIAQVQLEEGIVATPFEQRPYGTELALCQRYYFAFPVSFFRQSFYNSAGSDTMNNNTLHVEMRAVPTITQPTFSYTNASGAIVTSINKSAVRVGWQSTTTNTTQIDNLAGGGASAEL